MPWMIWCGMTRYLVEIHCMLCNILSGLHNSYIRKIKLIYINAFLKVTKKFKGHDRKYLYLTKK